MAAIIWPMAHAAEPQAAGEQAAGEQAADQPVIEPQVDRRPVKVMHIPSNDFEFGVFSGTYASQNFGSNVVWGARLGYHITEDFFAEAVYGQTRVSDDAFRQILPGGIFPNPKETLRYYNLSAGYNILPGEVFFWKNTARLSALYLIAGIGSTELVSQRHLTGNAGFGARVFLTNWMALQVDMRDYIFALDILGTNKTTQNLEFSGGITFFF